MSAPTNSSPQAPTTRPLQIGVLHENVQTTDLAGLDVLGNLTPETLSLVTTLLPQFKPLIPHSTPMTFHYLAPNLTPQPSTPSMSIMPTHTYATAPRDLDMLVLGGPDPNTVSEESLAFLREVCERTKTVMTTCTGAMWLAKSGVLNGKKATTNRVCLEVAKAMFPEVEWVDQRWVVEKVGDREIWTAGGAGCGVDMFIEYADQHFNKTLVELSCQGLDFEYKGRSQAYTKPLKTEV